MVWNLMMSTGIARRVSGFGEQPLGLIQGLIRRKMGLAY